MPSNIDKQFIENLQNFTDSLESVVELMKQQSEKGDAVNKMLSSLDGPKLSDISEDIKSILETNKNIDNRTKEILEEIKATRKQKEAGMFDKISNKENKEKIRDSIQTIILISGAVLAIGLAFKIVGKVDFLSVMSLSIALLTISHAFSKLAEIENLTPKRVFMVGLAVVGMATAITISSYILKLFQPLDALTMFSFIIVSSALGVASYFIFKAVDKLKIQPKDLTKYLLLPLILPAIALGIVLSSLALQLVQPIGLQQAISTVFVGIALVAAAFAVKMVMGAIGKLDSPKDLLKIGLAVTLLPILSGGIWLSSLILSNVEPITNPFELVASSLAIAISILAFTPAIFVLGKMKIQQMLMGALGAVVVSGAILASSWLISFGEYDGNYPSAKWAFGVGLSLIMFTPAVLVLGIVAMTGIGALAILAGAGMTIVVAGTIVATSHVLNEGDYSKYPSAKWAAGVGLSLITFGTGMVVLGGIALTGIGALAILAGIKLVKKIANTIVQLSYIFKLGDYSTYPSMKWVQAINLIMFRFSASLIPLAVMAIPILAGMKISLMISRTILDISNMFDTGRFDSYPSIEWVNSVNIIMYTYAAAMIPLTKSALSIIIGLGVSLLISHTIVKISHIYASGNYGIVPSEEWINSVGVSMIQSSLFLSYLGAIALTGVGAVAMALGAATSLGIAVTLVELSKILKSGNFSGGPSKDWVNGVISLYTIVENVPSRSKLRKFKDFIDVLKDFSKAANKLKDSGIDKLTNLTTSITIMSVIDDEKLNSVIKVLDSNKDKLSNVIDDRSLTTGNKNKQKTTGIEQNKLTTSKDVENKQEEMINKFDQVLEKFDQLLEFVIEEKSPEETGKKDSTKKGFWG